MQRRVVTKLYEFIGRLICAVHFLVSNHINPWKR